MIKDFFNKNFVAYFIGIGGVSMSAIAKFCVKQGVLVKGSDLINSTFTDELIEKGVEIFFAHNENNIKKNYVIIYNSAIKENNPELIKARKLNLKIYSRAEFLSKIIKYFPISVGIAGCHGKTTVTAMLGNILYADKRKFTLHLGGTDANLSNFYSSGNDIIVSEICEYKRNIDKFTVDIGCVLNVEYDHVDCYKNLNEVRLTYNKFLNRSVIAIKNQNCNLAVYEKDKKNISFSLNGAGDYYCTNTTFIDGKPSFVLCTPMGRTQINLNVLGKFNLDNAISASAIAGTIGVGLENIKLGLENFNGIRRRYEFVGKLNGARVICDYAHHPKEIKASLQTSNLLEKNKMIVVFQPHTYSRTRVLLKDFIKELKVVENLIIYPTYSAREDYDELGSAETLSKSLDNSTFIGNKKQLKNHLLKSAGENDLILALGAGDIYEIIKEIIATYQ